MGTLFFSPNEHSLPSPGRRRPIIGRHGRQVWRWDHHGQFIEHACLQQMRLYVGIYSYLSQLCSFY